jgi:cytoskeletal protein RodZ
LFNISNNTLNNNKSEDYYYIEINNINNIENVENVEIMLTTNLVDSTLNRIEFDDQIIIQVIEDEEENITIDPNKTTGLELDAGDSHAMRIRFKYNKLYNNVLKQFFNTFEKTENIKSATNDTNFTVFIIKLYRNRRTYILGYENIIGVRLFFIPLTNIINRRFLQNENTENSNTSTPIIYETADNVNKFTIFDLSVNTPIISSINESAYKISAKKPTIESGPQNVEFSYTIDLYNKNNIDDEDKIESPSKPEPIFSDQRDNILLDDDGYVNFTLDFTKDNHGSFYVVVAAKSNETKPQYLDYKLSILTIGKYYGDNSNNEYTSDNTFTKINKGEGKKSKWWIALIVLGIIILIGLIVWLIFKKFKTNEEGAKNSKGKKDDKNQYQESNVSMLDDVALKNQNQNQNQNPVNDKDL